MGYFDSVKDRSTSVVTAPSNVVHLRAEIHPYAQAIRDAWLDRLNSLPRPWVKGAAWDSNCFVTARKLIELANSPWAGYSLADAHADYLTHAPRDSVWDGREKCWVQAVDYSGAQALPEPEPNAAIPAVTTLDLADIRDEFWESRPLLQHIHTYAQARRVSPWATLGVVLARVTTATPPFVVLPALVGGYGSLNLFVGLVGRSGTGKGAAESVGAECFNVGHVEIHTTGSGEGIAHGYKKRGKNGPEWLDENNRAVLFSVPEIDTLSALGNRQGATLMPELRRGWSGERLGFAYADPAKRLPVEAHQYRMCLVAGIQPGRAQTLLDDTDGGTPQRFLWLPAVDPNAPDEPPECPEPLHWKQPDTTPTGTFRTATGNHVMHVCDEAAGTIDQVRLGRLRGNGEALDGHGLLTRLKVAAALALAEGRLSIQGDDWTLSGLIHAKSDAVRAGVQAELSAAVAQRNEARGVAEAGRVLIVSERVDDAAIKRVSRNIVRALRREGDWTHQGQVRKTVTSRDRGYFEEALDRLRDAGQVEVEQTEEARIRLVERGDS